MTGSEQTLPSYKCFQITPQVLIQELFSFFEYCHRIWRFILFSKENVLEHQFSVKKRICEGEKNEPRINFM